MILAMEADLVTRAAAGDALALDSMIRPLLKPAYRVAYILLRDREAAEDAVQEAALKSWRKLSKLRAGSDPRPWFLGFVANECRNMRRSRWRTVLKLGLRDDVPSGESQIVSNLDLRRALDRMSHTDRVVVLLYFYLDMTLEEIGIATGSRPAAVKSRLYRAIKRLRPQLDVEEAVHG
jgi:RNA polymerase sigma-70 factor, ECF subfamily